MDDGWYVGSPREALTKSRHSSSKNKQISVNHDDDDDARIECCECGEMDAGCGPFLFG